MRKLVIDRRRWLTGKLLNEHFSELLSDSPGAKGKMCCLGFYLRAEGVKAKDVRAETSPKCVRDSVPETARWLLTPDRLENSSDCDALMEANDASYLAASVREQTIARIFAKHDVSVTFVDGAK